MPPYFVTEKTEDRGTIMMCFDVSKKKYLAKFGYGLRATVVGFRVSAAIHINTSQSNSFRFCIAKSCFYNKRE